MTDPFKEASKFQTELRRIDKGEEQTVANARARAMDRRRAAFAELDAETQRVVLSRYPEPPAWAQTPAEPSGDIAPEAPPNGSTTAASSSRDLPAWATAEPEGEPPIVVERGERKTVARRT